MHLKNKFNLEFTSYLVVVFHEYCFLERIKVLEDKNDALKNQLMEMVVDKERRDNQLDQLGIALDARLAQWQVMKSIFNNIIQQRPK